MKNDKMAKMWIVSGPTCVGKSYFLWNKKDRLSEITNLPPFENNIESEGGAFPAKYFSKIYESKNKNICIHLCLDRLDNYIVEDDDDKKWHFMGPFHENWKKISELKTRKKVIILGVSYSEYKVRLQYRGHNWRVDPVEILDLYKGWVDELNKNKIPYLLVEAIGDYKILEEADFFKMLKDR